ncbi:MAG: dihydrofolate reductase family protein [Pseudomonadota bacterium]
MHPVIYDVAVSIDGFISGADGDISQFAHQGPVVDDYLARLQTYHCAIMGRATYEFGYGFGLQPGQNPYPRMRTYVFSNTITLPDPADVTVVRGAFAEALPDLRRGSGPVYLCGGGQFAGALLAQGRIDILRLKRAPILLGSGVPLFGACSLPVTLTCSEARSYDGGYLFQEFTLNGA